MSDRDKDRMFTFFVRSEGSSSGISAISVSIAGGSTIGPLCFD